MKVLIVHPCKGFYGGAEEVVVQLCNYLLHPDRYTDYKVVRITKDTPKEMWGVNFKMGDAIDCPSWSSFRKEVQHWLPWADIVNVHNAPAPLMTFPKKVPTVYMCNEPMELFTNWKRKPIEAFNRWWVKKSGMKVVVADQMNAHRFQRLYNVEPKIVPYGVDYEFWSQGDSYQGDNGKTLKLLQVGTITSYKNQLESILTLASLLVEGIDATLTLAGGITDSDYYHDLVDEIKYIDQNELSGIYDRVEPIGQQTQEQVRDLFHKHDVLLHPVKGQGGWLVPFEAMCAGLPVITVPSFSASDLIDQNKLGIVTGVMEGAIVMDKIQKLDIEAIRSWVKENLTWEKFGENVIKVFEEAIEVSN